MDIGDLERWIVILVGLTTLSIFTWRSLRRVFYLLDRIEGRTKELVSNGDGSDTIDVSIKDKVDEIRYDLKKLKTDVLDEKIKQEDRYQRHLATRLKQINDKIDLLSRENNKEDDKPNGY